MSVFASPFAIPIAAIVCVFAWLAIQSIVSGIGDIVKHRNEVELKQMLAERGMNADEIERVVQSAGFSEAEESGE